MIKEIKGSQYKFKMEFPNNKSVKIDRKGIKQYNKAQRLKEKMPFNLCADCHMQYMISMQRNKTGNTGKNRN